MLRAKFRKLEPDERLALVLRTLREEGAINRAPTDTVLRTLREEGAINRAIHILVVEDERGKKE